MNKEYHKDLFAAGIGIDDTFVMLAAWRRTPVTMSVPERMGHTMSDAAVSITITSVTDMVSLWIGMLSPFPSIQIFCLYSSKYSQVKSSLCTIIKCTIIIIICMGTKK